MSKIKVEVKRISANNVFTGYLWFLSQKSMLRWCAKVSKDPETKALTVIGTNGEIYCELLPNDLRNQGA